MKTWLVKQSMSLAALIALTIGGIWITGAYDWVIGQFPRASPFKIDFQAANRCVGGQLVDLRRHFADQSVKLEWGADRLVICDPDALETNVADAPRAIANAFPGCLKYTTGSLRMLRPSEAVCELPSGDGFICDGEAEARSLVSSALGIESKPVERCTDETLGRFGFDALAQAPTRYTSVRSEW